MTVMALKKNNMKKGPFKLKSGNKPSIVKMTGASPMKKEEKVVKGKTYDAVEVSGGKKTTFGDRNRRMTKSELRDAKINPQKGTTYYKNKKTGQMSTTN